MAGLLIGVASCAGYFGRAASLLDLLSQFRTIYVWVFIFFVAWYCYGRRGLLVALFTALLTVKAIHAIE